MAFLYAKPFVELAAYPKSTLGLSRKREAASSEKLVSGGENFLSGEENRASVNG